MAKFLNLNGLTTFFNQLKTIFASAAEVAEVEDNTENYVLNIDYKKYLAFDTKEIVSDINGTSPLLDVGQLDMMILG